jgi:transcriptional regulator with XRE-family HTH domain
MVERIKAVMAHYQLRAAQFSDAIGMQRSAVSHVLSGRNKPSLDFVLRIKRHFPEISLDWLTLGDGNMLVNEMSRPSLVSQNLFSEQPASEKASNVDKTPEKLSGFHENSKPVTHNEEVKDEEQAVYGLQKQDGRVKRVLFIYDDGTFSEFIPRK